MPKHFYLPETTLHRHIHVVLVEPHESLNIGSVARAMMNLGFSNLHLVSPRSFDIERAAVTGRWARDLLVNARVHGSLEDALANMQDVVGFSSYQGHHRGGQLLLPEWAKSLNPGCSRHTALLFGPEDTGLTEKHVQHCRFLIRIPTTEGYPSMNLAQAAVVVLFELSRLLWNDMVTEAPVERPSWNQYLQLDRITEEVLSKSGFFHEGMPATSPQLVKNLFRRMDMTSREMGIMLALFNRLRIALERAGH